MGSDDVADVDAGSDGGDGGLGYGPCSLLNPVRVRSLKAFMVRGAVDRGRGQRAGFRRLVIPGAI